MNYIRRQFPFWGIRFLAITRPFLANFDEILHEYYYLSIGHKKSNAKCLFFDFDLFWPVLMRRWMWPQLGRRRFWGPKTPTIKLAYYVNYYLEIMSSTHQKDCSLPPLQMTLTINRHVPCKAAGIVMIFMIALPNLSL